MKHKSSILFNNKKLQAQQMTEFLLAAPLLILFFVLLTEFAFMFNTAISLNNATQSATIKYLTSINIDMSNDTIATTLNQYIIDELENSGVKNASELDTQIIKVHGYPLILTTITFRPDFGYNFLPALHNLDLAAMALIPVSNLNFETYETNGITTSTLDLIQPPAPPEEEEEENSELGGLGGFGD